MKLFIMLMLCSSVSMADTIVTQEVRDINTPVPKGLEGSTIKVVRPDGTESVMSINEFKVVPRRHQEVVTKEKSVKIVNTETPAPEQKRNILSLIGGIGAQGGLSYMQHNNAVRVESNQGLVGGLQYQRLIGNIVLGALGETNETFSISAGLAF